FVGGANFEKGDVAGCMTSPAFSAESVKVSAYVLHKGAEYHPTQASPGDFRETSGRGPDLWGNRGIDLAAPDNPVAAMAETFNGSLPEGLHVNWKEASGTSGASANTAGMAALVVQANPGLSGAELRQNMLDSARVDEKVKAGTAEMWGV